MRILKRMGNVKTFPDGSNSLLLPTTIENRQEAREVITADVVLVPFEPKCRSNTPYVVGVKNE